MGFVKTLLFPVQISNYHMHKLNFEFQDFTKAEKKFTKSLHLMQGYITTEIMKGPQHEPVFVKMDDNPHLNPSHVSIAGTLLVSLVVCEPRYQTAPNQKMHDKTGYGFTFYEINRT